MLLTKKKIILYLCVIVLFLLISISINIIYNNSVNKKYNSNNKEIFANVMSPNYAYLGCYKDGQDGTNNVTRALPNLLGNGSGMTPDECYSLAKKSYDVFGLQGSDNQCRAGNSNDNSTTSYDKYQVQSNTTLCSGISGGASTNQVYKINPKPTTSTSTLFTNVYTNVVINTYDEWQVPEGVTQATFTVIGGCGYGEVYNNGASTNNNLGGNGAKITALVTVVPGDIYSIYVGGNANGFKGGVNGYLDSNKLGGYYGSDGTGSSGSYKGGGGGSASFVYNYGVPIIIAGGGGGCPNLTTDITNSDNIGGSGGINQKGDGGNGTSPNGVPPPLGGQGGQNINNNSTFGQKNKNTNNSGGAGGGSNGGQVGGEYTSGGAGGSYINRNFSNNYSFVTNSTGIPSILIDFSTPKFIYKGCYNDTASHALPHKISTSQKVESVDECYNLAKFNYDVFGLQNNGQCWAGNLAKDDYTQYGYVDSTLLPCPILGDQLQNQVYEIYKAPITTTANVYDTSPNYKYKGCYKDNMDSHALPEYYDIPAYSVNDCYDLMKDDARYDIFALQFGGECWAGNKTTDSYDKYGKIDNGCNEILGNISVNQVYEIIRAPTTTQAPTTTKAPKKTRPPPAITVPLNTISEIEILPEIARTLINSQQILNNVRKL